MTIKELKDKLTLTGYPDSPVFVSLSDGLLDSVVESVVITEDKTVIFARRQNG